MFLKLTEILHIFAYSGVGIDISKFFMVTGAGSLESDVGRMLQG